MIARLARASLLALCACGVPHTVTVLVPASKVPANTEVIAAVKTGVVEQYEVGSRLTIDGDVVRRGEVVGRVDRTDTLVIEASGGERFGRVKVTRANWADPVAIFGGFLLFGGAIVSWTAAGVCAASAGDGPLSGLVGDACLGLGFLGNAAAALIGGPLLAWGIHGELYVDTARSRVTVAPSGLVLRFW